MKEAMILKVIVAVLSATIFSVLLNLFIKGKKKMDSWPPPAQRNLITLFFLANFFKERKEKMDSWPPPARRTFEECETEDEADVFTACVPFVTDCFEGTNYYGCPYCNNPMHLLNDRTVSTPHGYTLHECDNCGDWSKSETY